MSDIAKPIPMEMEERGFEAYMVDYQGMLDGLDNPSEVNGVGVGTAQGITKSRGSLTPLKTLPRVPPSPPLMGNPPEGKPLLVLLWVLVLNFFTYQSFIPR